MPSAIMSWVNRSAIAARGCSDDAADAHRTRSAGQPHGPRARLAANLAAHWPRTARRRDPAPCPGRECGVCHDLCAVMVGRAAVVSAADRPVLPRDDPAGAPGTVAHDPAGVPRVGPTRDGRAFQDALPYPSPASPRLTRGTGAGVIASTHPECRGLRTDPLRLLGQLRGVDHHLLRGGDGL